MDGMVLGVSDFVAVLNQTLEYAYPNVVIQGELANFRVSKNRWVYFDLKDDQSSVKFFGTVYGLPGPLEDGMMLQVAGSPRLHQLYGFSVNYRSIQPVGEGSLKRAAALLEAKLAAEGLFNPERKRTLPYPPKKIGLIASGESAAYHDFIKVLNERWRGLEVLHADVQVQGEAALQQIVSAIRYFNTHDTGTEVLVLTRGGGSPEDLAAFSAENVTRAVAGSRLPTMVAIGHEVDVSLAELTADQRASTPSNAAQLLVPDKKDAHSSLAVSINRLNQLVSDHVKASRLSLQESRRRLTEAAEQLLSQRRRELSMQGRVLAAYNPNEALKRGYALVREKGQFIKSGARLSVGDKLEVELIDAHIDAEVKEVKRKK